MRLASVLLVLGVILLVAGIGLWSIPAALVASGVVLIVAAYVLAYFARGTNANS